MQNVCANQLLLEIHAYPHTLNNRSARQAALGWPKRILPQHFAPLASFFADLSTLYRPFYGEYNPSCGPAVRCFEISWVRRVPC